MSEYYFHLHALLHRFVATCTHNTYLHVYIMCTEIVHTCPCLCVFILSAPRHTSMHVHRDSFSSYSHHDREVRAITAFPGHINNRYDVSAITNVVM